MEEDRRIPRRLLSFDTGQAPWSRIGKVFSQRSSGPSSADITPGSVSYNRSSQYMAQSQINAMSASSDRKMAAIAGPSFLEVVEMQPNELSKSHALQLDQKAVVATAIEWGQNATKHQIALASTQGQLQLFSIASGSLSLCSTNPSNGAGVIRPPISSLSFSSMAGGNILAGAASDGSVRLWDVRQGLRRPASTFSRVGDIAREVQFRPDQETKLAAIYDSGMLQRWDVRKPNGCDYRVNAHMQGLTLNWHSSANYLATGGRDHLVHVWNMDTGSKSPEYSINTASAVGRVRWVPGDNSISSNALVTAGRSAAASNSRSICYWLLKSPWVPIYSLETHTDSIVDMAVTTPSVVWSASKDAKLVQHDLRYEPLVYDNFAPCISSWLGVRSIVFNIHGKPTVYNNTPPVTPASEPVISELENAKASFASSTKTSGSLSFLGSSFSIGNSSPSHGSSAVSTTTTPTSYFAPQHHNYHHHSNSMTGSTTPGSSAAPTPERNLAAMLNKTLASLQPSPIIGLDFLPPDGGVLDDRVQKYLFHTELNQSLSDACVYNANVSRYPLHTSNLWRMLSVAVEDVECAFLNTVTGNPHEIAVKWFKGEIQDEQAETIPHAKNALESTRLMPAVSNETGHSDGLDGAASYENNHDMYRWAQSPEHTWQLSGVSFTSETSGKSEEDHHHPLPKGRPATLVSSKSFSNKSVQKLSGYYHFTEVKRQFLEFVAARQEQWGFLSILKGLIQQSIEDGLVYTTTALVLLFKRFAPILDLPNTDEAIVTCIQILRSQRLFVTAAHIMKISSVWQDHMGKPETTADVTCYHCHTSLSENTAFFKSDSTVTGYWYCGRCKNPQGGCSLCNTTVKGLGIVVLSCGHRTHPKCWQEWLSMDMDDCPAGCGQKL